MKINNINDIDANYIISKSTLDDISEMKSLENELNINILSENNMKEDMQNENYIYFVLKDKEKNNILGYIAISYVLDTIDILSIVIKKDYQKKGFGSILLEYVIEFSKNNDVSSILLEVRSSNLPAIKLYEKYNFEKINTRKNYYSNPVEDALIYKLDII